VFGYTEEEALGTLLRDLDIYPEGTKSALTEHLERAIDGESLENIEVKRESKGGEQVDLIVSTAPLRDETGQITGLMTVTEDITERRRRERELRETKHRLDLALDGSDTGVGVGSGNRRDGL